MTSVLDNRYPKSVGDLLLPIGIPADGIALCRDRAMSATWKIRGTDMASETHHHMAVVSARLNHVFAELGTGWMLQIDAIRFASPGYAPEGYFPDTATQIIDEERRQQFLREGQHFETEYFLTATYLPPMALTRMHPWLFTGQPPQEKGGAQRALEEFTRAASALEKRLQSLFEVARLKSYVVKDQFGFEIAYDDQLRFIRRVITGIDHPFIRPDVPFYLNDLLCPEQLVGGLAPMLGRRHVRVVAIEGFPKASYPGILVEMANLPLEYRWSTRAILLDREAAIRVCDKARAQWHGQIRPFIDKLLQRIGGPVNLYAQQMVADAEELRAYAASGEVRLVHYSANLITMHEDRQHADANAAFLKKTIQDLGFGARIEDVNAVETLLGTFPADGYRNVRRSYLHTLNLADLLPMSFVWGGLAVNPSSLMPPHSPPLFYAATTGSTPFRGNLHAGDDLGHTIVIGPPGSGKSVLLALLVAQWFRYSGARVFVFDKGYSMYTLTKASGGEFYDIGGEKTPLSFCPLNGLEGVRDVKWAVEWIEILCQLQGLMWTPKQREKVTAAVQRMALKPSPGLTELSTEIQDEAVRAALNDYTLAGTSGHLLDARTDMLGHGRFVTFEMQHLMEMGEKTIVPVLLYLFRQIEKRLDGSPTLVILDEAWLYLRHELFRERIGEWLKTLRKKNAVVVLATQSISDIYKSALRDVILESCPNKILLPNSEAKNSASREFYDRLGLNDREIEIIQLGERKRDYYWVSPLGRRMISLGLGEVALAFLGVNGDEKRHAVQELMDACPNGWQSKWLHACGLEDWATYYEHLEQQRSRRIA